MNPEQAHGWFGVALEFMPLAAWQALVLSLLTAAALTYLAEFLIPQEWGSTKAKLYLYVGAALTGILCAICVWNALQAVPVGLVGALLGLAGRQVASLRWTWLSPRQTVIRRNAQGEVIAIKEGGNPTVFVNVGDPTKPK